MRNANIKKTSQAKQQNQTKTTNNNYIKKFDRLKKLNNKVKIASDKTETKQNNLSPEKIRDQSIIRLGNN